MMLQLMNLIYMIFVILWWLYYSKIFVSYLISTKFTLKMNYYKDKELKEEKIISLIMDYINNIIPGTG